MGCQRIRSESASGDFRLAVNASGVALLVTLTSRRKRRCHLVGHARMRWCCAIPSLPFQISFSSRSLVHFEYQSLAKRHCTPHIPLTFTRDLSRGHPPIRKRRDYLLIKSLAQALLTWDVEPSKVIRQQPSDQQAFTITVRGLSHALTSSRSRYDSTRWRGKPSSISGLSSPPSSCTSSRAGARPSHP